MNHASHQNPTSSRLVVDPVCGMQIDPASAAAVLEWQGQAVHFCSPRCSFQFRAQPEKYPLSSGVSRPQTGRCCG